jgi:tryptophan-rich hypothetical protein
MNQIAPKKLLHSKWTHLSPTNKERHFTVINVEFDDDSNVTLCEIEAILTRRSTAINWRELKNTSIWQQGWK